MKMKLIVTRQVQLAQRLTNYKIHLQVHTWPLKELILSSQAKSLERTNIWTGTGADEWDHSSWKLLLLAKKHSLVMRTITVENQAQRMGIILAGNCCP